MAYFKEEVTDLVNARFGHAEEYARDALVDSGTFLDQLAAAIVSYTPTFLDLDFDLPSIPTDNYSPVPPVIPTSLTPTSVPRIEVPALAEVTVPTVVVPNLYVTPPVIVFPDAPADLNITDPGEMPNVTTEFDFPSRPSVVLPAVPTFADLVIPAAPAITTPTFEAVAPVIDIMAPSSTFAYNEEQYQTDLKTAIEDKLFSLLTSGGTGLGSDVEAAIWDRARNRVEAQRERNHTETLTYFASRGWIIPPGVLAARLNEVDTEATRQLLDINRDIAVEQARLAQEQLKIIIATVTQYEGISRQHADQVANRAFEATKYTQQVAIEIFNASIQAHNLELEIYKTAATVFETRMRAALVDLERYKAELEGVKLSSEVQEKYIQIYNLQLQGIQIMSEMYKTEMQSTEIRANVERIKLEAYREKVNAYSARLQARTAEYNAYQARIGGELGKAQVFESEVRATVAQMEGAKVQADINIAQANATIQRNNALVARYSAEVDGYKAEVQAALSTLQATIEAYGLQIQSFDSQVKLAATRIDADIKSYDTQMTHESNLVQIQMKEAEINLNAAIESHKIHVEALKAGANVSAQLAASAMSSVSAAAQLSYDGGHRYSDSDSLSTQHIYSHSE